MKRFIGRLFAWIGGIVVVLGLVALTVGIISSMRKKSVSAKTILEVNLEAGLMEHGSDDPLAKLTGKDKLDLRSLLNALERAENDSKVVGLIARIGAAPMGMAQVQELRDAVQRFRSKGKFALAFSETFGEASSGNSAYYLATAFEQIWLQPSGDVGLTGVIMESPFIKGTLDKLGVVPRMDHRYEYKNAMNMFTEKKFTPAHKEAVERVAQSWYGQLVRGIAEGRKIDEATVRTLIDRGPYLGQEAVAAKLVDQLGYRDEFTQKAKDRVGEDANLLYLHVYQKRAGEPHQKGKTIAMIYGVGAVNRGKSDSDPLSGSEKLGSDTVAAAFRAASIDKDVKAIVFRVDSPGGSYVASDAVWREVVHARSKGKPVVVSMGNVAGSGGYFVAMAADKIVAQPGTITGSIGVLGGKMVPLGLYDMIGLSWDQVHFGQNATMWSTNRDYTEGEWAKFQQSLDRVYADFTQKVADGRKLPIERVRELAKGRIWTGEDAKERGLVDALGGIHTALQLAKQAADILEGEDVKIQIFPREKSPVRVIMDKLSGKDPDNSEREGTASVETGPEAAAVRALQAIQPVIRAAERAGVYGEHGVLETPLYPTAY